MDALRIGLLAPPWVPIPPPQYGGTELVVDVLARGLASAGNQVVLWTTGDSTSPVERRASISTAAGTGQSTDVEVRQVAEGYSSLRDCDVIHDHTFLGPLWALATRPRSPVAATVHGQFTDAARSLYRAAGGRVALIAISHHQRSTAPDVPVRAVIHHGIDLPSPAGGAGRGGYLAFLGRMSPDKGVHVAAEIARAGGRRLVIAAKMSEPSEHHYFESQVRPLLGPDVEYVGEVSGQAKVELLSGADALLNPIHWSEPFGLVMVEALAVGTPVVTTTAGSAPEIVSHGVTGFLCRNAHEMLLALDRLREIDRGACRRSVQERFSAARMVADHLRLYRALLDGAAPPHHLRPPSPHGPGHRAPSTTRRTA